MLQFPVQWNGNCPILSEIILKMGVNRADVHSSREQYLILVRCAIAICASSLSNLLFTLSAPLPSYSLNADFTMNKF